MAEETLPPVVAQLIGDTADFLAKLDETKSKLDDFASKSYSADLRVDNDIADASIDDSKAKLDEFGSKSPTARLNVDNDDADAEIDHTDEKLDEFGAKSPTAKANVDTSSGIEGMGMLISSVLALGPAAVAAGATATAALSALPGIFAGLGSAGGALGLGLSGLSQAFSATKTSSSSAGNSMITTATQALSSAQSIRQAAQSVQSAQQAITTAQTSSAQSIHSAQETLAASEQTYTQSLYTEQQAQQALTAARQAAQNQLQDYQDQLADGALSAQQDQLNLQTAQAALAAGPAANGTGPSEAQLQLNVQQATQAIKDQQDQYGQLQQTASQAQAAGVNGATSVQQAQNALGQSVLGVQNAQQTQNDDYAAYVQAQVTGAQNVVNAQNALTQAILNQQTTIQTAALNAQKTTSTGGGSTAGPFSALTSSGQKFVTFIQTNVLPAFNQLKGADQALLLPGLESAITAMMPAFEAIEPYILMSAKYIGDFATNLGQAASSSKGISDINTLFSEGATFIGYMGQALKDFLGGFVNLGVLGAPIVADIGKAAERGAAAFERWTTDGGAAKFMAYVQQVGPQVMKVIGEIAKNFVDYGKALAGNSGGELKVLEYILKLTDGFMKAHPAIVAWGTMMVGIGSLLAKVIGPLGTMIDLGKKLIPVIEGVGKAFMVIFDADPVLLAIAAAVLLVALAAYEIYEHWSGVVTFFKKLWKDVKDVFDDVIKFLKRNLGTIGPIIATLLLGPIAGVAVLIITHWNTVKTETLKIWGDIVGFFQGIPSKIVGALSGAATWLLKIGGDIISGLWDGITTAWSAQTDFATWLFGKVVSAITGALTWLGQVGSDIINGLWNGISSAWNAQVNFATWLFNHVVGGITDAGTWLLNTGWNILTGMWNGFINLLNSMGSFGTWLFNNTVGAIPDVTKWLENTGWNIIVGLWNGIVKTASWLWQYVWNFMKNNIENPIKSFFGISSPSTLMMEHGENIVNGLVLGITGKGPAAVNALKTLASQMTVAVGGSTTLGVTGVGNNGGISPIVGAGAGATQILSVTTPVQIAGQTLATVVTQYQLRGARSTGNIAGQWAGGSQTATSTGLNVNAVQR